MVVKIVNWLTLIIKVIKALFVVVDAMGYETHTVCGNSGLGLVWSVQDIPNGQHSKIHWQWPPNNSQDDLGQSKDMKPGIKWWWPPGKSWTGLVVFVPIPIYYGLHTTLILLYLLIQLPESRLQNMPAWYLKIVECVLRVSDITNK